MLVKSRPGWQPPLVRREDLKAQAPRAIGAHKKMKIKYAIEIRWIPEVAKYKGVIKVWLPVNGQGLLVEELQAPEKFLDRNLAPWWGEESENGCRVDKKFAGYFASSAEAMEEAKRKLAEELEFLKSIASRNREAASHEQRVEEEIEI